MWEKNGRGTLRFEELRILKNTLESREYQMHTIHDILSNEIFYRIFFSKSIGTFRIILRACYNFGSIYYHWIYKFINNSKATNSRTSQCYKQIEQRLAEMLFKTATGKVFTALQWNGTTFLSKKLYKRLEIINSAGKIFLEYGL